MNSGYYGLVPPEGHGYHAGVPMYYSPYVGHHQAVQSTVYTGYYPHPPPPVPLPYNYIPPPIRYPPPLPNVNDPHHRRSATPPFTPGTPEQTRFPLHPLPVVSPPIPARVTQCNAVSPGPPFPLPPRLKALGDMFVSKQKDIYDKGENQIDFRQQALRYGIDVRSPLEAIDKNRQVVQTVTYVPNSQKTQLEIIKEPPAKKRNIQQREEWPDLQTAVKERLTVKFTTNTTNNGSIGRSPRTPHQGSIQKWDMKENSTKLPPKTEEFWDVKDGPSIVPLQKSKENWDIKEHLSREPLQKSEELWDVENESTSLPPKKTKEDWEIKEHLSRASSQKSEEFWDVVNESTSLPPQKTEENWDIKEYLSRAPSQKLKDQSTNVVHKIPEDELTRVVPQTSKEYWDACSGRDMNVDTGGDLDAESFEIEIEEHEILSSNFQCSPFSDSDSEIELDTVECVRTTSDHECGLDEQKCVRTISDYERGLDEEKCVRTTSDYEHGLDEEKCVRTISDYEHGLDGEKCVTTSDHERGLDNEKCVTITSDCEHGLDEEKCVRTTSDYECGFDKKQYVITTGYDFVNESSHDLDVDRKENECEQDSEESLDEQASLIVREAVLKAVSVLANSGEHSVVNSSNMLELCHESEEICQEIASENKSNNCGDDPNEVWECETRPRLYSWTYTDRNEAYKRDQAEQMKSRNVHNHQKSNSGKRHNDLQSLNFKQRASQYGISITSPVGSTTPAPQSDQNTSKDKSVPVKSTQNIETKSNNIDITSKINNCTGAKSKPIKSLERSWSEESDMDTYNRGDNYNMVSYYKFSKSQSEDSCSDVFSLEGSQSDPVDAFKIKASMRGIRIEDPRDSISTESETELELGPKSVSRSNSIDVTREWRSSTPDPGVKHLNPDVQEFKINAETNIPMAADPTAESDWTDAKAGLSVNAGSLAFQPNKWTEQAEPAMSNDLLNSSLTHSGLNASLDSSMRVEAPEFIPGQSKPSLETKDVSMEMWTTPVSSKTSVKMRDASTEMSPNPTSKEVSTETCTRPESEVEKCVWTSPKVEKVFNSSVATQVSPTITNACVGMKRVNTKDCAMSTGSCNTRDIGVNTADENSHPRQTSKPKLTSKRTNTLGLVSKKTNTNPIKLTSKSTNTDAVRQPTKPESASKSTNTKVVIKRTVGVNVRFKMEVKRVEKKDMATTVDLEVDKADVDKIVLMKKVKELQMELVNLKGKEAISKLLQQKDVLKRKSEVLLPLFTKCDESETFIELIRSKITAIETSIREVQVEMETTLHEVNNTDKGMNQLPNFDKHLSSTESLTQVILSTDLLSANHHFAGQNPFPGLSFGDGITMKGQHQYRPDPCDDVPMDSANFNSNACSSSSSSNLSQENVSTAVVMKCTSSLLSSKVGSPDENIDASPMGASVEPEHTPDDLSEDFCDEMMTQPVNDQIVGVKEDNKHGKKTIPEPIRQSQADQEKALKEKKPLADIIGQSQIDVERDLKEKIPLADTIGQRQTDEERAMKGEIPLADIIGQSQIDEERAMKGEIPLADIIGQSQIDEERAMKGERHLECINENKLTDKEGIESDQGNQMGERETGKPAEIGSGLNTRTEASKSDMNALISMVMSAEYSGINKAENKVTLSPVSVQKQDMRSMDSIDSDEDDKAKTCNEIIKTGNKENEEMKPNIFEPVDIGQTIQRTENRVLEHDNSSPVLTTIGESKVLEVSKSMENVDSVIDMASVEVTMPEIKEAELNTETHKALDIPTSASADEIPEEEPLKVTSSKVNGGGMNDLEEFTDEEEDTESLNTVDDVKDSKPPACSTTTKQIHIDISPSLGLDGCTNSSLFPELFPAAYGEQESAFDPKEVFMSPVRKSERPEEAVDSSQEIPPHAGIIVDVPIPAVGPPPAAMMAGLDGVPIPGVGPPPAAMMAGLDGVPIPGVGPPPAAMTAGLDPMLGPPPAAMMAGLDDVPIPGVGPPPPAMTAGLDPMLGPPPAAMTAGLDPMLLQAVMDQLIQSYPYLTADQGLLTNTAIHQTHILQLYMKGHEPVAGIPDMFNIPDANPFNMNIDMPVGSAEPGSYPASDYINNSDITNIHPSIVVSQTPDASTAVLDKSSLSTDNAGDFEHNCLVEPNKNEKFPSSLSKRFDKKISRSKPPSLVHDTTEGDDNDVEHNTTGCKGVMASRGKNHEKEKLSRDTTDEVIKPHIENLSKPKMKEQQPEAAGIKAQFENGQNKQRSVPCTKGADFLPEFAKKHNPCNVNTKVTHALVSHLDEQVLRSISNSDEVHFVRKTPTPPSSAEADGKFSFKQTEFPSLADRQDTKKTSRSSVTALPVRPPKREQINTQEYERRYMPPFKRPSQPGIIRQTEDWNAEAEDCPEPFILQSQPSSKLSTKRKYNSGNEGKPNPGMGCHTAVGMKPNTGMGCNTAVGMKPNTAMGMGCHTAVGMKQNPAMGMGCNTAVGMKPNTAMGLNPTRNIAPDIKRHTTKGMISNTALDIKGNTTYMKGNTTDMKSAMGMKGNTTDMKSAMGMKGNTAMEKKNDTNTSMDMKHKGTIEVKTIHSDRVRRPSGMSNADIDDIPLPKVNKVDPADKPKGDEEKKEEEEWFEVTSKRNRHKSKEQSPNWASQTNPNLNKKQKATNFEKLIARLQEEFPGNTREAFTNALGKIRAQRGNLSGLSMENIIERVNYFIDKKPKKIPGLNITAVPPKNRMAIPRLAGQLSSSEKPTPGSASSQTNPRPKHVMNIPKYTPSSVINNIGYDEDEEDICVICHDGLSSMETKKLDCNHVYHYKCISQWVERERTCPTCRKLALFPEDFPRLGK